MARGPSERPPAPCHSFTGFRQRHVPHREGGLLSSQVRVLSLHRWNAVHTLMSFSKAK